MKCHTWSQGTAALLTVGFILSAHDALAGDLACTLGTYTTILHINENNHTAALGDSSPLAATFTDTEIKWTSLATDDAGVPTYYTFNRYTGALTYTGRNLKQYNGTWGTMPNTTLACVKNAGPID